MKPVQPYHVREGGDYWAAWGSKGWTAVRVTSVRRKWAQVTRVNPRTNEVKKRGAKVRLDEMVKRDPKQKGKDKPTHGPAVIFEDVRRVREEKAAETLVLHKDEPVETTRAPAVQRTPEEQEARLKNIWAHIEKMYGPGYMDSIATTDDW